MIEYCIDNIEKILKKYSKISLFTVLKLLHLYFLFFFLQLPVRLEKKFQNLVVLLFGTIYSQGTISIFSIFIVNPPRKQLN